MQGKESNCWRRGGGRCFNGCHNLLNCSCYFFEIVDDGVGVFLIGVGRDCKWVLLCCDCDWVGDCVMTDSGGVGV